MSQNTSMTHPRGYRRATARPRRVRYPASSGGFLFGIGFSALVFALAINFNVIERRLKARRFDTPLVFHRTANGRPGQPIKDFRKAWAQTCQAVGLTPGRQGGLTYHDTRRTAVRNLIRAGVDQTVAKKISGHQTDSTFERYNITSEDDLRDAVEKVAAYVETLPTERKIAVMGTKHGPNTDHRRPSPKRRK